MDSLLGGDTGTLRLLIFHWNKKHRATFYASQAFSSDISLEIKKDEMKFKNLLNYSFLWVML